MLGLPEDLNPKFVEEFFKIISQFDNDLRVARLNFKNTINTQIISGEVLYDVKVLKFLETELSKRFSKGMLERILPNKHVLNTTLDPETPNEMMLMDKLKNAYLARSYIPWLCAYWEIMEQFKILRVTFDKEGADKENIDVLQGFLNRTIELDIYARDLEFKIILEEGIFKNMVRALNFVESKNILYKDKPEMQEEFLRAVKFIRGAVYAMLNKSES